MRRQHRLSSPTISDCQKLYGLDVMLDASHRPYLIEINKASGTNHGHFTFIQDLVENLFKTMLSAVPGDDGASDRITEALLSPEVEELSGKRLRPDIVRQLGPALRQHASKGNFELVYPSASHTKATSTHHKELLAEEGGAWAAEAGEAFRLATALQALLARHAGG